MLEAKARWMIGSPDEESAERLCSELGVEPLLARLLVLRGIDTPEAAHRFLYGGTGQFYDPFLLGGMPEAVERIRNALRLGEKIRIYGDYDADGVSSTALMIMLMRKLEANFDYYIPHRVKEGYGLNPAAIDHARESGVSLIITVDTGISAVEQAAYIRELGMDVIITDHHEPPEILPDAYAVINPKKPGCPYPFKQLAGVGVALKLAHALLGELPEQLLEIAAIGTVADLMPLTDENRLIVKLGLERMRSTQYLGIQALLDVAGIDRKELTATHIGFAIGPRINASGRLEAADTAVKLLTASDSGEAERLAYELDALNKERQRLVEEMTKEALQMAEEEVRSGRSAIVLAKEGWNVGVIGIVASKVTETFYRPSVILGIDPETGMAKGSARSIAGFDLYKALTHCSEWLDHYGGHHGAAGMSLHRDRLEAFAGHLNELTAAWLAPEDFIPIAKAEIACSLQEVTVPVIEQLAKLGPFGIGNPTPRFLFTALRMEEQRLIGKDKQHLKLSVLQEGMEPAAAVDAVGFGKGAMLAALSATARLDALGEVSINEWNGRRKPQLVLQDLRVPHVQVFDWRGAGQRLLEKIKAVKQLGGNPVLLLLRREEASDIPKELLMLPAYLYDEHSGGLAAMNEAAAKAQGLTLSDVVLYGMPHSLDVLDAALRVLVGVKRCFAVWQERADGSEQSVPNREMFKTVYAYFYQSASGSSAVPRGLQELSRRTGLSPRMVAFIIEVFEELGFIVPAGGGYTAVAAPKKRELTTSRLYQQKLQQEEAERFCTYASIKELEAWIRLRLEGDRLSGASGDPINTKTTSKWEEVI